MTARCLLSRLIIPLALLALPAGILSCATPVETGPRAWIDWPRDGHRMEVGTTVEMICHAYAREGVAEVHLAVDTQPYRIQAPAEAGEQFVEIHLEWTATEPGDYLLSVTAFDVTGGASNPTSVTVTVAGEEPGLVLTPTEVATTVPATGTPIPPAATPPPPPTGTPLPPTATPPSPPTGTPRPPTATPQPSPIIVSFEANPPSVVTGGCSTLSWAVEGAISAVYLDGEGVGDHDSRSRCPTSTTIYTLRAVGPGGERTADVTVAVTQPSPTPQDTEGPLIQNETGPQQMWAPDGSACRDDEPYQFQANVSDPSGVLWVKLIYSVNQGPDQSGSLQLVSGTTYRLGYTLPDLQGDGGTFRWHIRACDMVNPMNCSDSGTHTISIFDCPI